MIPQKKVISFLGKVGFAGKAIVYGAIGGITINVALGGHGDSSPQGVFLLLGDNSVGIPVLIVMAVCLMAYSLWRFAEASTGQGSDAQFSRKKNIFKYRVSPAVSGLVYVAYTYYVIRTIFIPRSERRVESGAATTQSKFPDSWVANGVAGKVGVIFLGILFLVAAAIQLGVVATGSFRRDLYARKLQRRALRWFIHGLGYIGFLARALVFILIAALMFRSIKNVTPSDQSVTGKAIDALATTAWGKTVLIILGVGLLIYALFALLNVWFKIFPTPPRSRIAEISGSRR